MSRLVRLAFTPLGFVVVGVLLIAGGAWLVWEGQNGAVPERSELTKVTGVVQSATKRWTEKHGSKRDVKFELDVTASDAGVTQLTLRESQISEHQASGLIDEQFVALLRDNDPTDIWEFSSGSVTLVDYAVTRQKREATLASMLEAGPYVAAVGGVILLLGAVRLYRRRAAAEAA